MLDRKGYTMAEYTVEWIRPTIYVDNAGSAVDGFAVRIVLYPWNEARDLKLPDATKELIKAAAELEIEKREGVDSLFEGSSNPPKKPKKS